MSATKQQDHELLALGQTIKQVRQRQGTSTHKLAAAAGIEQQQIEKLETGELDPTYDLLLDLAEALDVELPALVIHAEELTDPLPRCGSVQLSSSIVRSTGEVETTPRPESTTATA
jgi:transcriptional regulator with XRE-family HTH domain